MCCFSAPVEVASTSIFARMTAPGVQLLVYQMQFAASTEVAMILPIPTPPRSAEDAVRFISVEGYPTLFEDLERAFAPPPMLGPPSRSAPVPAARLVVHRVGAFDASFVPALADFTRLDPRFRLPSGTLDRVPAYADWGFAVFQLAVTRGVADAHPMAFEFPTREPSRLFFPTVHVHDGALHAEAAFSHRLYAQGVDTLRTWEIAEAPARRIVDPRRAGQLFDLDARIGLLEMFGTFPNRDVTATLLGAL